MNNNYGLKIKNKLYTEMKNKYGIQSKEQVIYNETKNSFAKVILIFI